MPFRREPSTHGSIYSEKETNVLIRAKIVVEAGEHVSKLG